MIVDLLETPKPISKYDTSHIKRGSKKYFKTKDNA